MGYRDDLYNAENIIGYTGRFFDYPTVYFARVIGEQAPEFVEVGHITQNHEVRNNIGRQRAAIGKNYTTKNEKDAGKLKCVERFDGIFHHRSRSPFLAVKYVPSFLRYRLKRSITRFTQLKMLDVFGERMPQVLGVSQAQANQVCELALSLQKAGILDGASASLAAAREKRGLVTQADSEQAEFDESYNIATQRIESYKSVSTISGITI